MQQNRPDGVPSSIGGCRIEKKIGEGGMGSVYLGRHKTLDIPRAIKILPKHIDLKDPEYSQRFFREARIAARMRHPNMVQVHECGAEDGYYYLIMDYVPGPTCRQIVEDRGRMEWQRAVHIARQIARGLRYAASQGIIHRDVTPGNIIVDSDGTARITDLGLAKEAAAERSGLTRAGASLGTPYYMSPEQINSARDVDFRGDIYSLGATIYHMVCGKVPYTGTTFEVMTKQVREPLPSPRIHVPELPEKLCDVIRKMMAKDPEDRYPSYDELIEDLQNLLKGNPVSAEGFTDQSMVTPPSEGEIPIGGEDTDRSQEKTHLSNPVVRENTWPYVVAIAVGLTAAIGVLIWLLGWG
jgi:nicotinamidase/pyrazinamidase